MSTTKYKLPSKEDFSVVYSAKHPLLEPSPLGLVFVKVPTKFRSYFAYFFPSRKDKCNLYVTYSRTLSCSSSSLYYCWLSESADFCMAAIFPLQALAEEQSNSDQILQNLLRRLSEPQPAGFPAALRPVLLPLQSVGLLPRA